MKIIFNHEVYLNKTRIDHIILIISETTTHKTDLESECHSNPHDIP